MKTDPSTLLPGTATNAKPGRTLRLSDARPETVRVAKGLACACANRSLNRIAAALMTRSRRPAPPASSRAPGAGAHHHREWLARSFEAWSNIQERGDAFDDGARHG